MFSANANYPAGQAPWISINGQATSVTTVSGLSTPARVGLQALLVPANTTATVTFQSYCQPTLTVTVNYSAPGGCITNCVGAYPINASPGAVSADNSSNPTATQQVTLSTANPGNVPFSLGTNNPASWLQVTANSTAVTAGLNASLILSFNSAGLAPGQYNASITVNYGVSSVLSIPVTYTVFASNVVTLTPYSAVWSGATTSTAVTVAAGTPTITVVVNPSNPWILLSWAGAPSNYAVPALYNVQTSGGFVAKYNPAATVPQVGTQGTVTVTDANGHSSILTVTYNGIPLNGSGAVTLSPNPAAMSAALNGSCCVQTSVTVNSTESGDLSAAISGATCTACFTLSAPGSVIAGVPVAVVVNGIPFGLTAGTYSATLTVSVNAAGTIYQGTTQVSLTITGGVLVAPTSLAFAVDINHPSAAGAQLVTIADAGNYTATVTSGAPWLNLSGSGGTSGGLSNPALLRVIPNAAGMSAGSYTGTVSIQSASGTTQVVVSLTVYSTPVIYSSINGLGGAGSVNVTQYGGSLGVVPQLYVFASDGSVMDVQASLAGAPSWLQLNSTEGNTSTTPPQPFSLGFNAGNLANGLYTAQIAFTSSRAGNSPLTVPVVLAVSGNSVSGGINLAQSTLTLNGAVGGNTASAQLGVTSGTTTAFTATASVSGTIVNWLSVTPSGTASATTSYISVTANPSGLLAGTYHGTVTVTGGGSQVSAQITFVVSTSGTGGGNVVSSPASLTFTFQKAGALPASQNLLISNQVAGTGPIAFAVQTSVNGNAANWLLAAVNGDVGTTTGQTQTTIAVSVIPGSLAAGTYTGTVTITPAGGSVLSVPVTLTVQQASTATVTASPLTLNFSYQLSGAIPAPQTVQVSGSTAGLPYSVTVATTSGTGWLAVNKTSGTAPDTISVSVSPSGLAAGASYTGTVTVQGTGAAAASSPTNISVTLTVTVPFPTITSVESAASLANGPAGTVSPGEMVTIFGSSLGPAAALQTALDPTTHKVATTLGNVQVLFNGYAAPLTYVSATQINCLVPYELAQVSNPYVQVRYAGQPSNAYNLTLAATAPAIFTVNSAGSGQGAILNGDSSYNGTGAGFQPAAAGSVIQVYMTGEGQTTPAGVTGQVNCPAGSPCTLAQIPVPVLPVAAQVNGQPASIVFWGEAPGIVSGIMQVNLIIPPGTPSGPASLVIKVGSASSQAGVRVAVQ